VLEDLATSLRARGIAVTVTIPEGGPRPDEATEQLVFRVAQECLRNAARHSGADRVDLSLSSDASGLVLEVTDDGAGFDPAAALSAPQEGHFGLRILADLASDAGATLDVASAPGLGTRWRLTVPRP
jgi:signal transduction histidine kinase